MRFVELLIGQQQALLVRAAIDLILSDPERYVMTDEERTDYERLAVFFGEAYTNPARFAPTGQAAQTVKTIVRRAKGPAQPESRRNGRKERQAQRQGYRKMMRKQRKDFMEQYNAAYEAMQAELAEMQEIAAEQEAKLAAEPRFAVMRADGVPIITDVPESMIVPMPSEEPSPEQPKIILPGTAEALGL